MDLHNLKFLLLEESIAVESCIRDCDDVLATMLLANVKLDSCSIGKCRFNLSIHLSAFPDLQRFRKAVRHSNL